MTVSGKNVLDDRILSLLPMWPENVGTFVLQLFELQLFELQTLAGNRALLLNDRDWAI